MKAHCGSCGTKYLASPLGLECFRSNLPRLHAYPWHVHRSRILGILGIRLLKSLEDQCRPNAVATTNPVPETKHVLGIIPNPATPSAFVLTATKCFATSSWLPPLFKNQFFALLAFCMVSCVVKVLEAIMNSVVSASLSLVPRASQRHPHWQQSGSSFRP